MKSDKNFVRHKVFQGPFTSHQLVRYYLIWLKFSKLRFKISIFRVGVVGDCAVDGNNAWGSMEEKLIECLA